MGPPDSRLYRRLKKFVDLRPEESGPVLLLFVYFFLVTSTAYIIKPVKISLYLHWLSADNLPYAYLVTAVLIGFMVSLNSRLVQRLNRLQYISLSVLAFISTFVLFWVLFKFSWPWVSLLYWFWADLFIVTSVFQFWILVNDFFHPRQARRLVGFFVSGGLLGGIFGALLASLLAGVVGTENLLLACPVILGAGLVLLGRLKPHLVLMSPGPPSGPGAESAGKVGYAESFRLIRRHRFLLLLAGIVAAGIAVTTLLDFQFNSIVEKAFPAPDSRTSFLGVFFLGLLVFSYLFNVLLSSRAIRSFGLRAALLITPAVLLLGSAALFVVPVGGLIYWAVGVKGLDKSLAHTLHQSVRELLYIPVPPEIKYKAKVFIDMFVNKLADGLVALLLLALDSVGRRSLRSVSLLTLLFIGLWIVFGLLITREYVLIVKRHLKLKWQDGGRLVADKIDVDMTKLVFDTLQSKQRSSVLYAMNLFDLVRKDALSPELKGIIASRSDQIQASSLDSLLGVDGEPLFPDVDDSLSEETLDSDIKEVMSLDVYQQLMSAHLNKVASAPGAAAEVERMEAAKALGLMGSDSGLVGSLGPLLRDESAEVVSYALESAAKLKKREFVPLIVRHLAHPGLQQAASKTLAAYGDRIAGTLRDYLSDCGENINLRRAIPDILAQAGGQRAADLLAASLAAPCGLESEIIAAAAKLGGEDPGLDFPEATVRTAVLRLIRQGYGFLIANEQESEAGSPVPSAAELEASLARAVRDIFHLLGLIHPPEDIRRAYQNLNSGVKKNIDYSLELLESMLKKDIKPYLLPLIDDAPFEERLRHCRRLLPALDKALAS